MATETSPLPKSPALVRQYNDAYFSHVALRDELLDIAIQTGQLTETADDEVTSFHFNSLRAGVRDSKDELEPFGIQIDMYASTEGSKDSPGYVEQYGPHTADFPLFIGHTSVAFGEIIKFSSDPDYDQDAHGIGFPFVGFGLKLTQQFELDLPSFDQMMLDATKQVAKEEINETHQTLLPQLEQEAKKGREDYEVFMARTSYKGAREGDKIADKALTGFEQKPSAVSLINASLKASLRTAGSAECISQLFQNYAQLKPDNVLRTPRSIDYYQDLHLLALSKGRFAGWLLREAASIDRAYRSALFPPPEQVEEKAKAYLTEYAEVTKQVAAVIGQTKLTLGLVKPL